MLYYFKCFFFYNFCFCHHISQEVWVHSDARFAFIIFHNLYKSCRYSLSVCGFCGVSKNSKSYLIFFFIFVLNHRFKFQKECNDLRVKICLWISLKNIENLFQNWIQIFQIFNLKVSGFWSKNLGIFIFQLLDLICISYIHNFYIFSTIKSRFNLLKSNLPGIWIITLTLKSFHPLPLFSLYSVIYYQLIIFNNYTIFFFFPPSIYKNQKNNIFSLKFPISFLYYH